MALRLNSKGGKRVKGGDTVAYVVCEVCIQILQIQFSCTNECLSCKSRPHLEDLFSLPIQMYRKRYCTTPSISGGGGVNKMLKFYVKVFM